MPCFLAEKRVVLYGERRGEEEESSDKELETVAPNALA